MKVKFKRKSVIKRPKGEYPTCKYEIEHEVRETRLVMNCKECNGKATLKDCKCIRGVQNALSEEFNINSIILSHYRETQYTDHSVEMLKKVVQIIHELEQLSIRAPFKEYFESGKLPFIKADPQKAICEKCDFNPQNIFPMLGKNLKKDIVKFYEIFMKKARSLSEAKKNIVCVACLNTTKSDFVYLYDHLEELRAFIIHRAFHIIV
jgi:hypothetical protein